VITNTGNETVLIDELTDTFPGDVVDLLNSHCANLSGQISRVGEVPLLTEELLPRLDADFRANTAAVCVEMEATARRPRATTTTRRSAAPWSCAGRSLPPRKR